MMVLTKLTAVIILQYTPLSDNHVAHFRLTQHFNANYISVKLGMWGICFGR